MSTFPSQLRWLTGAVLGAAVAVAVTCGLLRPAPAALPLVLFGALMIFSEHRRVVLPNGVAVSASLMICMAAIVVFDRDGALLGPLLVGVASALYLPHFRRGRRGWIVFNAGVFALAYSAAAVAYSAVPHWPAAEMPAALLAAVPATLTFVLVNWALLAASYVIEDGRPVRELAQALGPSLVQAVPFAFVGVCLGRLYLDVGPAVVLLLVVPILVARDTFASYLEVKRANEETVQMLVRALEAKDRYTAGHAERVANYARLIGEELRFTPARLERLRFAALMHDIGKLVVPNHLLNKPGKLTAEEFARVRMHESVSAQMLSHIDFLAPVAQSSLSEHTEYQPDDAKHPIEPYIVMVADAYDAMTSTRSYRLALPRDVAIEELRDKAGTQFHPECADALIRALERIGAAHDVDAAAVQPHWQFTPPEAGVGSAGLGDLIGDAEEHRDAERADGDAAERRR
ncbi:MAG TPA: HD domain-containing phosphohydrolase [Acidimicrobiia bacterium]